MARFGVKISDNGVWALAGGDLLVEKFVPLVRVRQTRGLDNYLVEPLTCSFFGKILQSSIIANTATDKVIAVEGSSRRGHDNLAIDVLFAKLVFNHRCDLAAVACSGAAGAERGFT
jgi:hypothetical protein